jgi:hypothetical protein
MRRKLAEMEEETERLKEQQVRALRMRMHSGLSSGWRQG